MVTGIAFGATCEVTETLTDGANASVVTMVTVVSATVTDANGMLASYENLPGSADCAITETLTRDAKRTTITVSTNDVAGPTTSGESAKVTSRSGEDTVVAVVNWFDAPEVGGDDDDEPTPTPTPTDPPTQKPDDSPLPITGTESVASALGVLVLLTVGGVLVAVRRRKA